MQQILDEERFLKLQKHFDNKDDVLKCVNTAYETAKGIRLNLRRIREELSPIDIEKVGLIYALELYLPRL